MPIIDGPKRQKIRKAKPKPAVRPQTKTPAATAKPKPATKPAAPVQRGHSSEGGRTIRPKTIRKITETNPTGRGKSDAAQGNSTRGAETRARGKSDAAQGNRTSEADAYKTTPDYQRTVTIARRARIKRDLRERKAITPSTTRAVKGEHLSIRKELEGSGIAAKILSDVANEVTKPRGKGKGGAGGMSFAAALVPELNLQPKKLRDLNVRALKDAVNFPAQAVPSAYVPAAGVVEAAQGRPERLKKYVEDVKQTDPIYNTVAAGVEAVKGNKRAAKSHIGKAGKAASEHPGFTALEVYGAKGTLGRGAGRVMRTGVVGKRAKRAASTRREPATLPGTRVVQKREFSPDVTRKARQATTEKVKIRRSERTREKAKQETDPDRRAELQRKATRQDPRIVKPGEVRRRVDERLDANESTRRIHRPLVQAATRKIVRKVRRSDRPAISVVAQNITKASKDDIRAYIDELKTHHDGLDPAGQRANARLRRDLQRVVDDPKADLVKVETAAREYEQLTAPLQKKLIDRKVLAEGRGEKAKLIPYAVRNMGAGHDKEHGLVDQDGIPLGANEIRAHMEANGVREPAFLTQAPNQRGARNFNIRSERAQSISNKRRTGEATRKGTFDADPETLTENAARAQGLVDATDGFRGFVGEFAARKTNEDGNDRVRSFVTKTQADKAAANLEAETGVGYRPIRVNPFGASRDQLNALLEDVNSDNQFSSVGKGEKSPLVDAIEQAIHKEAGGDGPWALVPEEAAGRLQEHLSKMGQGPGGKVGQLVNSAFRKTVLSTSTSWVAGNIVEAGFRSGLAKAGPRSYFTGRKVLKTLTMKDLEAAEQLAVRAVGGGHFSFADRAHVRRDAEQFRDTKLEGLANALGKFWRAPGPKQTAAAWHGWTTMVFHNMRRVESQFQTAMLGKAVRDSQLMDGQTMKLSKRAIDQAADGLKDTNEQVAMGRAVDRMYGRYGKLSPEGRLLVAYYTPFIAWTINAVKFVADVLPRDHPTTTALIAQAELATEEWRKDHGLDMFMQGAVPGWLQGSIPVDAKGGKQRAPSRYLPFGAFSDPLETAASAVLPQFSGLLAAMKGQDWTGRELKGPDGGPADTLEKARVAAGSFAGATIPALSLAQRVAKDGPSALNPLRVTRGKEEKPRKLRRTSTNASSTDVIGSGRSRSSSSSGFDLSGLDSGGGSRGGSSGGGFDLSGLK